MNDRRRVAGWLYVLDDLGNTQPSRFSKVTKVIGSIAASILLVFTILMNNQQFDSDAWQMKVGALCLVVFIVCVFILAVRHLAIFSSGKANARSIGGVFARTLLYVYVPAILLLVALFASVFIWKQLQV